MKYEEMVAFLQSLADDKTTLGLGKDLSLTPEIFNHKLRVKGLYIWGYAKTAESLALVGIEWEMILFNETNRECVECPEGYVLFRVRDFQEFPYLAAVRPIKIRLETGD